MSAQDQPWVALDTSFAETLGPEMAAIGEEIIAAIGAAIPEYRRPMEGSLGRGVRRGVGQALGQFVELIGQSEPRVTIETGRPVYEALGRGELRAGRSLDALQAAYRLGARVAWRRVSAAATRAGADAEQIALLAEAIFAYIDEISAISVEGYAAAQAEEAGELQRRRQRVVRLLIVEGDARPEPSEVEAATLEARWQLPRSLAVLLVPGADAPRLAGRLGAGVIGARLEAGLACLLVPDPAGPGRRRQLEAAIGEQDAALGPEVAWPRAAHSLARSRAALRLRERGVIGGAGMLLAEEWLSELIVHGDPELLLELRERRLAALEGAGEKVTATLACWLRHQGAIPAVADELGIHRQTVRYRLGRLRELLGDALDDPQARFELALALRADPPAAR